MPVMPGAYQVCIHGKDQLNICKIHLCLNFRLFMISSWMDYHVAPFECCDATQNNSLSVYSMLTGFSKNRAQTKVNML